MSRISEVAPASRRPIVRSDRLTHRRTHHYASQEPAPTDVPRVAVSEPPLKVTPRRRFRFARAVIAAASTSAAMANAEPLFTQDDAPHGDLAAEVLAPDVIMHMPPAAAPEVLPSLVTLDWVSKLEGLKSNPYGTPAASKLVRKIPRARRIAWRKSATEDGPSRVSDLKANPYD